MWQSAAFSGALSRGGAVPAEFGTEKLADAKSAPDPRHGHADESIAGEDVRELLFAPAFGAFGPYRDDDVTHVSVGIVHANRDARGKLGAELLQHRARLEHDSRAIVAALVPRGR